MQVASLLETDPRCYEPFVRACAARGFFKSKMATGGAEEHFAKKLANNEKKIRDRAVNKLRAWIRSRPKDGPGKV